MVYPQMNHIERPEGIIISSAIQVDVDGDKRTYSAVPGGTLTHRVCRHREDHIPFLHRRKAVRLPEISETRLGLVQD